MEQRILQYRKQIDEWLQKMEQRAQTLSQDGEYSTQAIQRQSDTQKTDTEKTDTEEQTMQEMVQDKLQEHLVQVGFFQHERLIHLIVTVTFALLEMLAIVLSVISDSLFTLLLPVVILILLIGNIVIVQQSKAYVVERLGAFRTVWGVGLHLKVPFVERVAKKVSLKEQVADFAPQPVITKDNVTMQIDTVIYFQITDPKLYTYGVERPMNAIENLTATTLRNIIGEMELDQSLTSRDTINAKMRAILDEATDPWGIKVNRVELKNIIPPKEIQNAMEKQMKAERERRESILQAEGQKQSQILVAEGEKQSLILKADAAKQAAILKAEGEKEARIMAAEAEAQAIMQVQTALADSLKLLNAAAPNDQVVKLKALEAMQKVADGKATKIIIPSELQGLAGLAASAKTVFDTEDPKGE